MTDQLESRLRTTLGHAAEHAPKAPSELRTHVVARSRRRRTRRQALVAAVAVAAVAVPLTLTAAGGKEGDGVATGTIDTRTSRPSVMDDKTPLGDRLMIGNPSEGRPLTIWYAKGKTGTVLCRAYESRNGGGNESCGEPLDVRKATEQGSTESLPAPSTGVVLYYGTAPAEVAGVTAVIKGGGRVTGTIHRPQGAPQGIWTVSAPVGKTVTTFEFADAEGRTKSRFTRKPTLFPEAKAEPIGPVVRMPGGLSVDLYEVPGKTLLWKLDGQVVGLHIVDAGHLMTDLGSNKYPVELRDYGKHWLGIASAKTARVTLIFADGRSVSADTQPDPWNLDVKLFAGTYDRTGDIYREGFQVVGYDDAGVEIWQDKHPAQK
ncbi:hypothetical protein [Nonomuraea sp. NEAU-A123]|uniref:hypothetical protein n=1 Tax=Nonomuraea sp. NEAU-A123 TaxID=2839649 RepID=UPI001BE4532C|nr:hypothetical protein [Nonomuraea sp. NEAU-A123]MBT2232638.1 hypothetical protein [Nonomuraea sp. NEAU-A123]